MTDPFFLAGLVLLAISLLRQAKVLFPLTYTIYPRRLRLVRFPWTATVNNTVTNTKQSEVTELWILDGRDEGRSSAGGGLQQKGVAPEESHEAR